MVVQGTIRVTIQRSRARYIMMISRILINFNGCLMQSRLIQRILSAPSAVVGADNGPWAMSMSMSHEILSCGAPSSKDNTR